MKKHNYKVHIEWTGNDGDGTLNYRSYNRNHRIWADGKSVEIPGSSDPSFMGDTLKYNPEELLISSISACHMLWFLHLCSANKIVVTAYVDRATGIMEETENGGGRFTKVTLNPHIKVKDPTMITKSNQLHKEANKLCFIANSCNFNIEHKPTTIAD